MIEEDHYAVDSIRPKCLELQRICQRYKEMMRQRQEDLMKSRDLQERIDKVRANILGAFHKRRQNSIFADAEMKKMKRIFKNNTIKDNYNNNNDKNRKSGV